MRSCIQTARTGKKTACARSWGFLTLALAGSHAALAGEQNAVADYGAAFVTFERTGYVDAARGSVVRDTNRLAKRMFDDENVGLVVSGRFVEVDGPLDAADENDEVAGIFVIDQVLKGAAVPGARVRILLDEGILADDLTSRTRAFERGESVTTPWANTPPSERRADRSCRLESPGGSVWLVRCGITVDDEAGAIRTKGGSFVLGLAAVSNGAIAVHNGYPYLAWGAEAHQLVAVFGRESTLGARCTEWRRPWDFEPHPIQRFFGSASREQVRRCLAGGVDPNRRDLWGRTALHWAAQSAGDAGLVELLVDAGGDLAARDGAGLSPVAWAAGNIHGNAEILKTLLAAAREPAVTEGAMHRAAHNGNLAMLRHLLDAGVDPDERAGSSGRTPLHDAAAHCGAREKLMSFPYVESVDVSTGKVVPGVLPSGCRELGPRVDILLSGGADVALRDGNGASALHWAARDNPNPEAVEVLVEAGLSVAAKDLGGATPLHYAAGHGRAGVVSALLSVDAQSSARDSAGATPLHWATRNGDFTAFLEVVRALRRWGADLDAKDEKGRAALHYVVGDPNKTRALLAAGADVAAVDAAGRTALETARNAEETETVQVLRRAAEE